MGHCGQSIAAPLCRSSLLTLYTSSSLQHIHQLQYSRQAFYSMSSPWAADSLGACPLAPPESFLGPKRHPYWRPGDPPDLILPFLLAQSWLPGSFLPSLAQTFPRLSPACLWLRGPARPCAGAADNVLWENPSLNSSSLTALSLRHCTTWGSWSTDWIDRALDLLQTNNFLVNVFIYKLYRPILKYLLGAVNKALALFSKLLYEMNHWMVSTLLSSCKLRVW